MFGGGGDLTIEDLAGMVAGDKTMSTRKKLRICLIIIVDGVLITIHSLVYFEMTVEVTYRSILCSMTGGVEIPVARSLVFGGQ